MFNLSNIKKINKNLTLLYNNEIIFTNPKNYNIDNIEEYLSSKITHYNILLEYLKNNIEHRALKHELVIDENISRNMAMIHQNYNSDRYKIVQKIQQKEREIVDNICSQI